MDTQSFGLEFDHFGLATCQPDRALTFLAGLGYRAQSRIYDPIQKVNLVLCQSETMPAVEVISPGSEAGPLDGMLTTRDAIVYHLCYRALDPTASLTAMKQAGHRVVQVSAPQPAILFGNRTVGFYLVKGFGLIELIGIEANEILTHI